MFDNDRSWQTLSSVSHCSALSQICPSHPPAHATQRELRNALCSPILLFSFCGTASSCAAVIGRWSLPHSCGSVVVLHLVAYECVIPLTNPYNPICSLIATWITLPSTPKSHSHSLVLMLVLVSVFVQLSSYSCSSWNRHKNIRVRFK